ncbi:MAG: hypothetical protein IAE95_09145 [Chitinophagaceae bacterium]|nr:hypothetical protein [Chitinophagaceae bacterium]
MHTLRKLSLFVAGFFLLQAAACRKDKKITPASPKTNEDYIRQMVGTRKMVGEYVYTDPDTAYRASKEEAWVVKLVSSTSVSVDNPSRVYSQFVFIYHDTARQRIQLYREPNFQTVDYLYYYYLKDSFVYYGYTNTSLLYYEENLHSVK